MAQPGAPAVSGFPTAEELDVEGLALTWRQFLRRLQGEPHVCDDPNCGIILGACPQCNGRLLVKVFRERALLGTFCAGRCSRKAGKGNLVLVDLFRLDGSHEQ